MKKHFIAATTTAMLMAFAGAAGAQGMQTPAQPDPAKGGQASTKQPMGNTANPTQVPDGTNPASRAAVRDEARAQNRNNSNTMVPKGEASTMMNGQPNATMQPSGTMSRAQVSQNARKTKPMMGEKGEKTDVPTNPMPGDKAMGTPK